MKFVNSNSLVIDHESDQSPLVVAKSRIAAFSDRVQPKYGQKNRSELTDSSPRLTRLGIVVSL